MPAPKKPDAPFQPNLYLVVRFLDALARPDVETTRAQLQAAVGVNYDIFRRYLAFLEGKGLVSVRGAGLRGGETIVLTREGRDVRDELRGWIGRLLGDQPFASGAPRDTRRPEPDARETG